MTPSHPPLAALAALVLLAGLAACGGSDSPTTSAQPPVSTTAPQAAVRPAAQAPKGIVVMNCSATLQFVDPESGAVSYREFLPNQRPSSRPCEASTPQLAARFNKDFSRRTGGAATFIQWRPSGTEEVDVGARRGEPGDFERSRRDRFSVFRPGTEELWFVDASDETNPRLVSTDAGGGPFVDHGPYPPTRSPDRFESGRNDPFILVPRGGDVVVLTGDVGALPNPEASVAISTEEYTSGLRLWRLAGKQSEDLVDLGEQIRAESGCSPRAWVDNRSIVCAMHNLEGDYSALRLGTFSPDYRSITYRDLLPPAERRVVWVAVSPDAKELAFVLGADDQHPKALFRVGLEPGAQPRRVADFNNQFSASSAVWVR